MTDVQIAIGLSQTQRNVRRREKRAQKRDQLLNLLGSGYIMTKHGVIKRERESYVFDPDGPLKETLTAARAWTELLAGQRFEDQPGAD